MEAYKDVKEELLSSEHLLTSYQIKPKFVEFTDCVRYAHHPQDLEVIDATIYCELYENIGFNQIKSPFREMDSDNNDTTTDLCSWSWHENDQMFNITLNKTYVWNSSHQREHQKERYGVEIVLTCNVKGPPEFKPLTSPDSKFLSFFIPFLVIKNQIRIAAMGSNTSNNFHRTIGIVLGGITTVLATTLIIIFYKIKKRRERSVM